MEKRSRSYEEEIPGDVIGNIPETRNYGDDDDDDDHHHRRRRRRSDDEEEVCSEGDAETFVSQRCYDDRHAVSQLTLVATDDDDDDGDGSGAKTARASGRPRPNDEFYGTVDSCRAEGGMKIEFV